MKMKGRLYLCRLPFCFVIMQAQKDMEAIWIMVESIVYCIFDNDKDERKNLGLEKNLWQ